MFKQHTFIRFKLTFDKLQTRYKLNLYLLYFFKYTAVHQIKINCLKFYDVESSLYTRTDSVHNM